MARQRPLMIDLTTGVATRIDPSYDVLDAKIEATDVLNLDAYINNQVSVLINDSNTLVWTYIEADGTLTGEVRDFSLTNQHISPAANISWTKIDKTTASLADIPVRYHEDLQGIQGGVLGEHYHLSSTQHTLLTTGVDASALHNHDGLYYTKTQLQTSGQSQVHWDNVTDKPTSYPPSAHTHPSSDVTDFTEAAQAAVGNILTDSDSIDFTYDSTIPFIKADLKYQDTNTVALVVDAGGLKANVKLVSSPTVALTETASGVQAEVVIGSLTNDHLSPAASIEWSKISKVGSHLADLEDVLPPTASGQALIYNSVTGQWEPIEVLTTNHRTLLPIDHPDGSVTEPKLADGAVSARTIAANVDVSAKGFNADKVDGKDVNDLATDDSALWTAQRIISYVSSQVGSSSTAFQNPVLDKDLCEPPLSPTPGDRYIVCPSGATGDWTGQENNIAEFNGVTWEFSTPQEGWVTWVEDENKYYVFDGTAWVPWASSISHENLADLQGGQPGEHYHLTSSQFTGLTAGAVADGLHKHSQLVDPSTGNPGLEVSGSAISVASGFSLLVPTPTSGDEAVNYQTLLDWSHQNLVDVQGGDSLAQEYYHLTALEYAALQSSAKLRVFDNLTVRGGMYLKTKFPMYASKDYIKVYQNGTLLSNDAWDLYLGPYRCGSAVADLTDTIVLAAPDTTATYRIEYLENTCSFKPHIGLTRDDGLEMNISRVQYLISREGEYYFLTNIVKEASPDTYTLTYQGTISPSVTITKRFPNVLYIQGFSLGQDLSPWRIEVWKIKPRNRHKRRFTTTEMLPRYLSSVNKLLRADVFKGASNARYGMFKILLRETTKNIVTEFSEVILHRKLSVKTNDGIHVGSYEFLEIR